MLDIFDRKNTVEHHDDHFDENTSDIEWLGTIAKWDPKPVVVSSDLRILRNPAESQALRGTELTFFALEKQWPQFSWEEWAWRMVKVWPLVVRHANPRTPTVFRVPTQGQKIESVGPTRTAGARSR